MADWLYHAEDLSPALGAALARGIRYLLVDLEDMGAFFTFVCICRHIQSTPVHHYISDVVGQDNLHCRETEIKPAGARERETGSIDFYKFKRDKVLLTLKPAR
jgi:hypothetical protein